MNSILEPLLGILAVLAPIGMAYVILLLQSRKPDGVRRKEFAFARNDALHKGLIRDEEKIVAR